METGYQLFVDGRLAGSFGPILNYRAYAASSRAFAISLAAVSGPRTFHIAIRTWHAPVWADYAPGGFFGSSYFGDSQLIAQRASTARSLLWNGLVDEYTYAILGTLVGVVVLVLFFIRREEREYLWFGWQPSQRVKPGAKAQEGLLAAPEDAKVGASRKLFSWKIRKKREPVETEYSSTACRR
jgi:hypothetical protein